MRTRVTERIVSVGGGTGSYTMLTELKKVASSINAVVAMTDSGGSSRRLMDEFGRPLPLGDLRQALVALSRSSTLWRDVFTYRFPDSERSQLGGHSLGNLILHALEQLNGGDLVGALDDAAELLSTAGRVLPVTLEHTTLCAELEDGSVLRGESAIDVPGDRSILPILRAFLDPPVLVSSLARKALERAEVILIGPGDLYTSIVPCLLVEGVAEAIRSSEAQLVYICNVMTKRGETDGYAASDFVQVIHRHLGRAVDAVVVNTAPYPDQVVAEYRKVGAQPVVADIAAIQRLGPRVVAGAFAHAERLVRHDAERVLEALWPELSQLPAAPAGTARPPAAAPEPALAGSLVLR